MRESMSRRLGRCAMTCLFAGSLVSCALDAQQDAGMAPPSYQATITRTKFGIPHIKAQDFGGLGFGAAYARAQDNICLMAESYVSSAGERSKFFGPDGDTAIGLRPAKNLDSDAFYRAVTDLQGIRATFTRRSADYRALVDGYVSGYNRYLGDHKDSLPAACAGQPWVRLITRDDVLLAINSFAMTSSSATVSVEIVTAAPPAEGAKQSAAIHRDVADAADEPSIGSNGWAFGGDATVNGKGLVVGNPHFPWFGPNRFYETHLTIPGKLDVAGVAVMTFPFIGIGFNRDVAWTHTVDMAAHMTLFRLKLDPSDPTAYWLDGRRESMIRHEVSVETKEGTPIARTIYTSRFGPVVSIPGTDYVWTRQTAYAVADADNGNIRSGDTWLAIAQARSVDDVRKALSQHLGTPFLNTMAADRAGTALYADISAAPNVPADQFASCGTVHGRLPGHLQDLYVLDGSRSACGWETSADTVEPGLLPPGQMSALFRRDYVQNSNDSYRWSNPAAPQTLGPIMGRDPGLGMLRTRAAIQEIGRVLQSGKFDIDLAAGTMLSNRVLAADLALPSLLKLCARPSAPTDACAALAQWDGKANLDSKGAMLFNLFWLKAGTRPDIWKVPYDPNDPLNTPRGFVTEGKTGDELLAVLTGAAEAMKKAGLRADSPLGEAQFAGSDQGIPISGLQTGGVLNYAKDRPTSKGFMVLFGSSYIQSVSFDDQGPVAKSILTYSQSSDPASPYYADQTREFSKLQLHRFPFSEAEIAADAIGPPLIVQQ